MGRDDVCEKKVSLFFLPIKRDEELRCHSYVYHYSESTDRIDVWFAKSDYKTSDYFFHELEFLISEAKEGELQPWRAKSSHLCKSSEVERENRERCANGGIGIEDLYNVTYEFSFSGTTLAKWTSRYEVKGPKKDYVIENVYTRPV